MNNATSHIGTTSNNETVEIIWGARYPVVFVGGERVACFGGYPEAVKFAEKIAAG